jgi:CHASE3 domain sensor protein
MDDRVKGSTTELKEEAQELASEVKEEVQELAGEAKEAVGGVVQLIVLGLCTGFLAIMLGVLLLVLAII